MTMNEGETMLKKLFAILGVSCIIAVLLAACGSGSANGTWENGTAQPTREGGAPVVKDVNIGGNSSATIGPFTTAGTFKLYCTVHAGMNLTVIVE